MKRIYTVKQSEKGITFKDGRRFVASIERGNDSEFYRSGEYVREHYRTFIRCGSDGGVGGSFAADEFRRAVAAVCDSLMPFSGDAEFHGIENIKEF